MSNYLHIPSEINNPALREGSDLPSGKETLTISQGPHITQACVPQQGPPRGSGCGMGRPWQEDDHTPTYRAAKPTHSCPPGRALVSCFLGLPGTGLLQPLCLGGTEHRQPFPRRISCLCLPQCCCPFISTCPPPASPLRPRLNATSFIKLFPLDYFPH